MTRTILILDEDTSSRNILQRILEPEGYDVIQAESEDQTIALANTLQIDLFVIDAGMSRAKASELCRRIRGIPRYRRTPIIVSSSADDDPSLRQALAAGADDFLLEPFTPLSVMARVRCNLQRWEYAALYVYFSTVNSLFDGCWGGHSFVPTVHRCLSLDESVFGLEAIDAS